MKTSQNKILIVEGVSSETLSLVHSAAKTMAEFCSYDGPSIFEATYLMVHSDYFPKPESRNNQLKSMFKKYPNFKGFILLKM